MDQNFILKLNISKSRKDICIANATQISLFFSPTMTHQDFKQSAQKSIHQLRAKDKGRESVTSIQMIEPTSNRKYCRM